MKRRIPISVGQQEVYYLLQADQNHDGWYYVDDQVLAPGVLTVTQIGPNSSWVATFAGYDPDDAPIKKGTKKFVSSHRRPYFVDLGTNAPVSLSVTEVSDKELQSLITPTHK